MEAPPKASAKNLEKLALAGFDAGFELGTLSPEARASFLVQALEYFGMKPEDD